MFVQHIMRRTTVFNPDLTMGGCHNSKLHQGSGKYVFVLYFYRNQRAEDSQHFYHFLSVQEKVKGFILFKEFRSGFCSIQLPL